MPVPAEHPAILTEAPPARGSAKRRFAVIGGAMLAAGFVVFFMAKPGIPQNASTAASDASSHETVPSPEPAPEPPVPPVPADYDGPSTAETDAGAATQAQERDIGKKDVLTRVSDALAGSDLPAARAVLESIPPELAGDPDIAALEKELADREELARTRPATLTIPPEPVSPAETEPPISTSRPPGGTTATSTSGKSKKRPPGAQSNSGSSPKSSGSKSSGNKSSGSKPAASTKEKSAPAPPTPKPNAAGAKGSKGTPWLKNKSSNNF